MKFEKLAFKFQDYYPQKRKFEQFFNKKYQNIFQIIFNNFNMLIYIYIYIYIILIYFQLKNNIKNINHGINKTHITWS